MAQRSVVVAWTEMRDLQPAELAGISEAEILRASDFKSERRRREFLCARALLRYTLQRFTGKPAAAHELLADDKGKPVCVDGPAVSIAHGGDLVVCAVCHSGDVGVDIEVPGSRRDIHGIAENYFAEDEVRWLATQPDDRFFMLWVLKEAWLKSRGVGIAGGLDRLSCIVTPPRIRARSEIGKVPTLKLFGLHGAYVGLAMTGAGDEAPAVVYWDPASSHFDACDEARIIAATR